MNLLDYNDLVDETLLNPVADGKPSPDDWVDQSTNSGKSPIFISLFRCWRLRVAVAMVHGEAHARVVWRVCRRVIYPIVKHVICMPSGSIATVEWIVNLGGKNSLT
jgi:hypothetical protein